MTEDEAKEQFIQRFEAELTRLAGMPPPEDQEAASRYARQAAEAAWDDPRQRDEGPEECAAADYSYWEE